MSLSKLITALVVAIAVAFALMALPTYAQTPTAGQGKIDGQIVEGTKGATLAPTAPISLTLYSAAAGMTSAITQTAQADASGHFTFSNLDTNATTRYLAVADYNGLSYSTDILTFGANQTTLPVTLTVYETTTDPAGISVQQTHLVMSVQTRSFVVDEIVVVQNNSDRTYIGATATGPHRITLSLPLLAGAQDIQFQDPQAGNTSLPGTDVISYTMPFMPGSDQVVFEYTVPFNPPTYEFNLKLPFDTNTFSLLWSDVGATMQSQQLGTPTPFSMQGGPAFVQSTANGVKAGTTIAATFNNLPATVATPTAGGTPPATAAPTNNTLQIVGVAVIAVAALAAVGLLLYPILRRRQARAVAAPGENRRMELLQAMADLDDEFEAGKIPEQEYRDQRAQLKAELLELGPRGEE